MLQHPDLVFSVADICLRLVDLLFRSIELFLIFLIGQLRSVQFISRLVELSGCRIALRQLLVILIQTRAVLRLSRSILLLGGAQRTIEFLLLILENLVAVFRKFQRLVKLLARVVNLLLGVNLRLRVINARLLELGGHLRAKDLRTHRSAILPNRFDLLDYRRHQLIVLVPVSIEAVRGGTIDLDIQIRIVIRFERRIRHQDKGADLAAADKAVAALKGYVVRRFHDADDLELRRRHGIVQILAVALHRNRAANLELLRCRQLAAVHQAFVCVFRPLALNERRPVHIGRVVRSIFPLFQHLHIEGMRPHAEGGAVHINKVLTVDLD